MLKKLVATLLFFQPLLAQEGPNILDQYIMEGMKNNLALQQREISLDQSLEALREAKGMFFPSVSIQARYSRAGGGRMFEIPIGDFTNPVFHSLNELFRFHGIDAGFPTNIPNEIVPFLRKHEQDTKVRLVQPIFQPAIYHNYKIKSSLTKGTQAQLSVFKRQLIADIKTAYFNHSKALNIVKLLEETSSLLEENLRVSENLLKYGKATEDVVYRARAEIADLDQKRAEAEKNRILAARYFNFLINRSLDEQIKIADTDFLFPLETEDLEKASQTALEHRMEFEQMRHAIEATSHQLGLAKSNFLPSVFAVFDYGIQGEEYSFGKDDDYWTASLILEWTLFNGNQNRSKKVQASLEKQRLEVHMAELEKQILLEVQDEYYALTAVRQAINAARKKEQSAKKSFEIVSKKYEYGMAPQIEYLDARTTYTNAAINSIIARYDYLIQKAKFERASALSDIDRYE